MNDTLGLILLLVPFLLINLFLLVYFAYSFFGIPYVPSKHARVELMVSASGVKPGMRVLDLGSGDGRVVIAFAKAGARADGYEFNPILVLLARFRSMRAGLSGKVHIYRKDFWKADLSQYDIITIYGLPMMLGRLEKKFAKDLKPGARVISNAFPLPTWNARSDQDRIYCYEKPVSSTVSAHHS